MPQARRLKGTLEYWKISTSGGFGHVVVGEMKFFLHKNNILSGDPIPGSSVEFTPLPPVKENKKYCRAGEAVIENPPSANSVRRPAPRYPRVTPSALATEPDGPRSAPKALNVDTTKLIDVLAGLE